MKTKLLITIVYFFTFIGNTFSQEYHPMLNNSSWLIYDWVSCCRESRERLIVQKMDEVIGTTTYKKFSYTSFETENNQEIIYYLREDIIQKKVYRLVGNVEFLIYDFSFELGSTINQYGNNFVVTSVDNIDVEGGTRKRITLKSNEIYCGSKLTLVWIEGVGSDKHPFFPDFNMYIECSSGGGYNIVTKCSFQNGEHVYGNSDCSLPALSNNDVNTINQKIDFLPNPFTSQLTIQSEIAFENTTLKLYNSVGQLVYEDQNLNGKEIILNRNNLLSGLYLAQLFQKGKLIKTNKIIIAD